MNNKEIRALHIVELRATTDKDGGHTLSAKIPYNSLSADLGGFREKIAPGAFASALKDTADVLCLRDHDSKFLMGRTKSGTLTLRDTPDGLQYTCKLPNTTQANDLFVSVSRGDLDSTSFGFITNSDDWKNTGGNVERTLLNVELLEVSPCSFPAYDATSVSVRSCPVEIRSLLKVEKRDDLDADPKCNCDCDDCEDGNCDDCSNDECDDEQCSCRSKRSVRQLTQAEEVTDLAPMKDDIAANSDDTRNWKEHTELRLRLKIAFAKDK
jgi:hypothetical protein